jgi:hypothetical protein
MTPHYPRPTTTAQAAARHNGAHGPACEAGPENPAAGGSGTAGYLHCYCRAPRAGTPMTDKPDAAGAPGNHARHARSSQRYGTCYGAPRGRSPQLPGVGWGHLPPRVQRAQLGGPPVPTDLGTTDTYVMRNHIEKPSSICQQQKATAADGAHQQRQLAIIPAVA